MTFKKGQSGNPAGRPKGVSTMSKIARDELAKHKDALLTRCIEMAMDGSESMMKLLLGRLLPAKPKDDVIEVDITADKDVQEQSKKLLNLIYEGKLTPIEGLNALQAVMSHDTIKNNSDVVQMALKLAESKK